MKLLDRLSNLTKNKFFISTFDQGIISGSNFIITILLVKFIGLEEFGKFSFLWIIINLSNSLQVSSIIAPMNTITPSQGKKISSYHGGIFVQQVLFSIIFCVILFIAIKFLSNIESINNLMIYSSIFIFSLFAIQFQNFVKRLLFVYDKDFLGTLCDLLCYVTVIILIIYFYNFKELDIEKILIFYAVTFLSFSLIGLPLLITLKLNLKKIIESFKLNFMISKWMIFSTILNFFCFNLWLINLNIILGPIVFGAYRACQNIAGIFNVVFLGLENFLPKKISQILVNNGIKKMKKYIGKIILKGSIIVISFSLLIFMFSEYILNMLYGGSMSGYYYLLITAVLLKPIEYSNIPLQFALRALKNTRPIFIAVLTSSLITVLFSYKIISNFQINGFIFGVIINQIILSGLIIIGYLLYINKTNNEGGRFTGKN